MQAKRKLLPILLVVIVAAIIIVACGGGAAGQEKTWFNFPALPLNVKADGSTDVYGIGLGPIVPPALVQQLQAADVQQLQVRAGANGIHIYNNGKDLPYLAWDGASANALSDVLATQPNGAQIKGALPWLRQIGLGVNLKLPPGEGKPVLAVPRWSGETAVTPEQAQSPVGPLELGVSYDASGQPAIAGMTAADLAKLGVTVPPLDANTLAMLKTLGVETLKIKTEPNGVTLTLGDKTLPSIAYDSAGLQQLFGLLGPILGASNSQAVSALEQALPMLSNLDALITINFNGQPVAIKLPDMPLQVGEDGSLKFSGLSLPGATIPPDTVSQLTAAGVKDIAVNAKPDSILLAVNGQTLPKINFTPEGLNVIAGVAGISPDMITTGLNVLGDKGLNTSLALPGSSGAVAAPAEPNFAAPEANPAGAATFRLKATVKDGQITSVGGLSADQLSKLGVTLPTLPPNVNDILKSLDAKTVDIVTKPNELQVSVNGNPVTSMQYDKASLDAVWNLAKPFLKGSPAEDPGMQKLIEGVVLPMLPTSNVSVNVTVE